MERTFNSTNIDERQEMLALEMSYFGTILAPLFKLSCPECEQRFHIVDTDFKIPWRDNLVEYLNDNWEVVAEGWADNWGAPPIGTIFRKGVGATNMDLEVTARNFDIPPQPASEEVNEITCLGCDDNYDLRDLEYRHIPMGHDEPEELETLVDKYDGMKVWSLNRELQ